MLASNFIRRIVILSFVMLFSFPAFAEEKNPVVLKVNDKEFRLDDLEVLRRQLPAQQQQLPLQALFPFLTDRLVDSYLLSQEAKKQGINKEEDFIQSMKSIETQVLSTSFLRHYLQTHLTSQLLEKSYQEMLKEQAGQLNGQEEIKARHILLKSEEDALKAIGRLNNGEDFSTLAKSLSVGPSGPNGGDLGYFSKGQMVPTFEEAAFALDVNGYTTKPVKTEFGWHIIKLDDRRQKQPPSLNEVETELKNTLERQLVSELILSLRQESKIVRFNMDGSPQEEKTDN